MKGLVSYHLLNAAAFQNSSCAVDGHFQYIGTNGNGKTTNLRVPLYFYNPSPKRADHAIEPSKRAFNDFYFKGQYSFIIFEVCRGKLSDGNNDLYHIAVNRKGGRPPSFIFIDAPYRQELYASLNGTLCNENELHKNLLNHGIPSESVNSYTDFTDIIYGTHTNARFKPYIFAIPKQSAIKSIYTIPRILSSIFRSETMKTETLKEALIASLGIEEEQLSIDLHNTGKELKQFNAKRRDVQKIEGMRDKLKFVLDDFRNYQNAQTAMHSLARQIKSGLPKFELAIHISSSAINTAEQEIEKAKSNFSKREKDLDDKKTTLNEEGGSLNQKLKDIKTHQEDYPDHKIKKWERSEQELPQTEKTLQGYEDELEVLNQRFKNIETKYSRLKESLENTFAQRRQSLEIGAGKKETHFQQQLNDAHSTRRNLLDELERSSQTRHDELVTTKNEIYQRCRELKQELAHLELDQFRKIEINAIESDLKILSGKLKANEYDLKAMPDKATLIDQQYKIQINELAAKHETLLKSQRAKLEELQIKIDKERPLVDRYQDSLLDYADQHNISQEALRSLVREEVLLMPSEEILSKGSSPKDSLLGLQVNLHALPAAPELDFEQAKLRLEQLQLEHEQESSVLSEKEEAYSDAQNQVQAEHSTIRDSHRIKHNKLREESATLTTEIETKTRALESERSIQNEEYQNHVTKTTRDHNQASIDLTEASENLDRFIGEKVKAIEKIKTGADEKIESVHSQIESLKSNLSENLSELDLNLEKKKSDLEVEMEAELQSGSSDPEKIAVIKHKCTATEAHFKILEKQVKELDSYRQHILPKVQKLPEVLEQIEQVSEEKKTLEAQQRALTSERTQILDELKQSLKHHEDLHGNAQKDQVAYLSWAKTFPRLAAIEENSSLTTYKPGDIQTLVTRFRDESTASENLWNGAKDHTSNDHRNRGIAYNVRSIIKPFSANNLYGFPEHLDSDIEIEEFIPRKIEPLITTDIVERERKHILNAFHLTMKNLSREYSDMERHKSQLQRTLTGVQKSITGKKIFVSAIENIEFRMEASKSKLGTLRDNLKSCIDKLDTLDLQGSTQDDFFKHHPDSREIEVLLDQVQTLCNEITDHKIDRISLGDLFEMQIRITENGNMHQWKSSVHGIGSEGTDTLAKVMIYVGILSHFKSAAFKNADELHLHCLVDEIGRIHSDYVSELLHFCNERGIFLATASPETHRRPGDFQNTYLIERSADQRQAKICKALQVGVSVA